MLLVVACCLLLLAACCCCLLLAAACCLLLGGRGCSLLVSGDYVLDYVAGWSTFVGISCELLTESCSIVQVVALCSE